VIWQRRASLIILALLVLCSGATLQAVRVVELGRGRMFSWYRDLPANLAGPLAGAASGPRGTAAFGYCYDYVDVLGL
jgi:hypothetical protein